MRNHIPCMAHLILLGLDAFMSSLSVKGRNKSWEAHLRNQQSGENDSTAIGKSQQLQKEGNAGINKVSAMRPGFTKIIEKVRISRHFESLESDLHIAENACGVDYADTWSSKRLLWLSKGEHLHCCTMCYGHESTVEFDTGVGWVSLPITRIHPQVAQKSQIQWFLATLHNSGRMDHCQVRHGSI